MTIVIIAVLIVVVLFALIRVRRGRRPGSETPSFRARGRACAPLDLAQPRKRVPATGSGRAWFP